MDNRLEQIKQYLSENVPSFQNEAIKLNFEVGCRWLDLGNYSIMLDFWEEDIEDAEYPYYMVASVRETNSSYFAWDWTMPCDEDGGVFCWASIGEMEDYSIEAKYLLAYIECFEKRDAEGEDEYEFDWAA